MGLHGDDIRVLRGIKQIHTSHGSFMCSVK